MAREIVKVRKVGQTLVVTLTQGVLVDVPLREGDRVLLETEPPGRILISREERVVTSIRRAELELEILEREAARLGSQLDYVIAQRNLSMPTEPGMDDASIVELTVRQLQRDRDVVAAEIAKKRLEQFDLQPGIPSTPVTVRCVANNLPMPDDRSMAQNAIETALREVAGLVRDYSIVASPNNDRWQLSINAAARRSPIRVDIPPEDQSAAGLGHHVECILRRLRDSQP
jgi:antitoxin component of MazEF toxin-antitoxin module